MIKVIVEIEEKRAELKIDGPGEALLLKDVIPAVKRGTPMLAKANQAEVTIRLLSGMLKDLIRQKAVFWEEKPFPEGKNDQ